VKVDTLTCQRCVMDKICDPLITFNLEGVCNHCERYAKKIHQRVTKDQSNLDNVISSIKRRGRNSKYDCIVGISGGVDSTYVAYVAKKNGLRVLAVHLDNGWNSDLAVSNIEAVLSTLEIPLKTIVLDWFEFSSIQKAFLRSDTPDGEIPTDHAIFANLWKIASDLNVKTILSGMNFQTESISVESWSYGHMDGRYVRSVSKAHGHNINSRKFPLLSITKLAFYSLMKRIKTISILNYLHYDKAEVVGLLSKELGWRKYEGKHFESNYTKFYQGYYLLKRFNIDKRKGHLSDLINSGQISRAEALEVLLESPLNENDKNDLLRYVSKRLDISSFGLENLGFAPMSREGYKSDRGIFKFIKSSIDRLRSRGFYPK
jgi:N-acetyl sugar amidotransferase